jgi:uroporphyrinogen decarboxylase
MTRHAMTPADLVRATLAGQAVPHPPCSFWTHFPGTDLEPEALAHETLAFARRTGIDLIKSMPNGLYCVEDWGVVADYSEIAKGGVAHVVSTPIRSLEDWGTIRALDIRSGALGRELDHLDRLVRAAGPHVPVLATVFSPLTIAKKLCPAGFAEALRSGRHLVEHALSEIAATVHAFSRAAIEIGCAGVFFAVQDATPAVGAETYAALGRRFDLDALAGAQRGWCNAIHLHGDDVLFDAVADYPVPILNWHIGETAPSIADYRRAGGSKAILGGLRRTALTTGDFTAIAEDIAAAYAAGDARGVIFGPGCVIRHPCDTSILRQVVDLVREPRA